MYDCIISGIRNNFDMFHQAARNLQNIENANLPRDMVDMLVAEKGVTANIKALQTEMEMTRHMINLLA